MPLGEWRTKITHPDGSSANSGDHSSAPIKDIGVAYTNLRSVFDGYRGRLQIGPGHYLTEDWPIIKHDRSLHIEGWGVVNAGDIPEYYGNRIMRPDTVASDGESFMRPLTLAELAVDREIREDNFSVCDCSFDENIPTATTATTRAPIIQISHGGND